MEIKEIFPNGLDFNEAYSILEPVAFYILGMSVYAIFVFAFYRFLAAKDMFEFSVFRNPESNHPAVRFFFQTILYVSKYLFIFPVVAFIWFATFTILLSFLAPDRPFSDILLVALAVVGSIRISAYVTEDLSKDLAKILPFAVLGIFIVNVSFFKTSESFDVLRQANENRESILYYLAFLIVLEFGLRIVSGFFADVRNAIRRRTGPRTAAAASVEASQE